ncbi:MAG: hypothetical protein ACXAEU_15315 [Candidatus Hodarchaeales archaeon]
MPDVFTSWLNALLFPLVDAYSHMLEGFPLNFFSYIISAFMLGMVMQLIFLLLPPLKSAVDAVMFPFRLLHVWLHVQAAREIIEKKQVGNGSSDNSLEFISYFSTGFNVKAEKSSLVLGGICSPREASTIANAPLKGALALLLLLTLLTPILRTSFIGKLIHLYIFVGIATASFPSTSDYKFTYNMVLVNASLPSKWILLPAIAFATGFLVVITWSSNIIFALIWGIAVSVLTTWALLMVIIWKSSKNSDESDDSTTTLPSLGETDYQPVMNTVESYNNSFLLYQLENDL